MPTFLNGQVVVDDRISDTISFISVTKNHGTITFSIDNSVLVYTQNGLAFQLYNGKTDFIQQLSQTEPLYVAANAVQLGRDANSSNITSYLGDKNGGSFLQSNLSTNNVSKNDLVIVEPVYSANKTPGAYEGGTKNVSINSINYNNYRNPVAPSGGSVSIDIFKNDGTVSGTTSVEYSSNNPLVPKASVLSIPTINWSDHKTMFINSGTAVAGEDQYTGTSPAVGALLDSVVISNDDNILLTNNSIGMISTDNEKFVDSKIGIIRNGDEITNRTPAAKVLIKPQYKIDKEEATDTNTTYSGITKSFNNDLNDARIDPYTEGNLNDPKTQINFVSPTNGVRSATSVNIIKKSDYYTKIANKSGIFFDPNDSDIKTDEDATGKKYVDIGVGMIYAIKRADLVVGAAFSGQNALFGIPIQFTPEISGESRSATWTTSSALTRTNEYFVWANTTSRSINFRTSYTVISTDSTSESWFSDGINPIYDSEWGKYWTEQNIMKIIDKYRKLIIPYGEGRSPPVVALEFGTDLNNVFSDTAGSWSRWIVTDVNIDTRIEMGYTKNRNPRMYDVALSLKEMAPTWRSFQTHDQY